MYYIRKMQLNTDGFIRVRFPLSLALMSSMHRTFLIGTPRRVDPRKSFLLLEPIPLMLVSIL